jgi:hypothetical protein
MYIVITEDGCIFSVKNICNNDLDCSDAGVADIIDISNSDKPLRYFNKKWHNLEVYETE